MRRLLVRLHYASKGLSIEILAIKKSPERNEFDRSHRVLLFSPHREPKPPPLWRIRWLGIVINNPIKVCQPTIGVCWWIRLQLIPRPGKLTFRSSTP